MDPRRLLLFQEQLAYADGGEAVLSALLSTARETAPQTRSALFERHSDGYRSIFGESTGTFDVPSDRLDDVVRFGKPALIMNPELYNDHTMVCVPLLFGETARVLCVDPARGAAANDHEDMQLLTLLTAQAALALERLWVLALLEKERTLRFAAEDAHRKTHNAMIKHQQVGKMGDFRFNTRTGVSYGSLECYKLFGFDPHLPEVDFSTWTEKIVPEDRQRIKDELAAAIAALRPFRFEYRIELNGGIRYIVCEGQRDTEHMGDLHYYGVLTDVTERKTREDAFRRMQSELANALRLASLGELAGSIIHEVNQPLSAIIASAEAGVSWLRGDSPEIGEARESLLAVIRSAKRAAGVVAGLRKLARGSQVRLVPLQLNLAIREVLALARADLERARISWLARLEEPAPDVCGDHGQLQQVLLNLIQNSIDSLSHESNRGRELLISSLSTSDSEFMVSISDNGQGVEAGQEARLFETLHTTKMDGLGLGLAICRKIIASHNGRIWAIRNPEHGLTVNFTTQIVRPGAL
jgi:two-component system sensor kinase FixL